MLCKMFKVNRLNITKKIRLENIKLKKIALLSNSMIDSYNARQFINMDIIKYFDYRINDSNVNCFKYDECVPRIIYDSLFNYFELNEKDKPWPKTYEEIFDCFKKVTIKYPVKYLSLSFTI